MCLITFFSIYLDLQIATVIFFEIRIQGIMIIVQVTNNAFIVFSPK